MSQSEDIPTPFSQLGLAPLVVRAIEEVGYEAPSSIQAGAIPPLLAGRDLLGQAQTGTGKTGAFALPLLSRLDLSIPKPQILVLAPTRELAIQVAEAMKTYARHLEGFHVLPVYGGQSMEAQIRHLGRGVHAVVGTPGRILDHLRRGTLKLDVLRAVVLDEADEMLRMGFIEDVTTILEQTPANRQVALFSATMPPSIRKVAQQYLKDPVTVRIKTTTATVATVTQRYWEVTGVHKLTALTRILEVEDFDAMLIFVRTKNVTVELAEKLEARGFACAPLNGDMPQSARERTIERLKQGSLDIVVATDVAARGLHVERISHVVNYDVPQDPEGYVHRIGRTARAGREGQAILFVSPRERFLLRAIERATGQRIEPMRLPTQKDIADRRIAQFKTLLTETLASQDLELFEQVVTGYCAEQGIEPAAAAAALTYLVQRTRPFVPAPTKEPAPEEREAPHRTAARREPTSPAASRPAAPRQVPVSTKPAPAEPAARKRPGAATPELERPKPRPESPVREAAPERAAPRRERPVGTTDRTKQGLRRYRLDVGREHGVFPKLIVDAISDESGLDRRHIGDIEIQRSFTTVELPPIPSDVLRILKRVRILGRPLRITPAEGPPAPGLNRPRGKPPKATAHRR